MTGRAGKPAPRWRRRAVAAATAGLAGAAAMVPVGAALRSTGHEINRYGVLLARALTGTADLPTLLLLHLAIGALSAFPLLLWPPSRRPHAPARAALGAGYGAGYWLVVNALVLPWWFGRTHPWQEGWVAAWPSLVLHLVYGAVALLVIGAMLPPPAAEAGVSWRATADGRGNPGRATDRTGRS